jgi:hypothetical protein
MGWALTKVATFNIDNINKRLDNLLVGKCGDGNVGTDGTFT